MSETTDRNEVRANFVAGGWVAIYGDLINEWDVITMIVSIPTGTIGGWVSEQVNAQLTKFQQSLQDVAPELMNQATAFLQSLWGSKNSGERDFNGLGVKGAFLTYHRRLEWPGGWTKLPENYQPAFAIRVSKPLPPKGSVPTPGTGTSGLLDSHAWYKIKNPAKPGMALDVVNDGNQERDARIQMAADGDFSGQYWQFRPSKFSPGTYNLCTMWLGASRVLDVYGDDKTRPHLTAAGNYSGQQWHVESRSDGGFKMTNNYSGSLVLSADAGGSELHLRDPASSPSSQWALLRVRAITESGFEI